MKKSTLQTGLLLFVLFLSVLKSNAAVNALDSLWHLAQEERDALKQNELFSAYALKLSAVSTDEAIALCDSLISHYDASNLQVLLGRTISLKAWLINFQSRYKEGLQLAYDALEILKKEQDTLGIALTINRIGITNLQLGRFDLVEERLKEALGIFSDMGDTVRMDMILNNLGVAAQEQKKASKALGYYKQSLALRKKMGMPHWEAYSYSNIANSFEEMDQPDSALKYTVLALETFQTRTKRKKVPALAAVMAGFIFQKVNDQENALKWAYHGLKDAEEVNHQEVIVLAKTLLSQIYEAKGNYEMAYDYLKEYTTEQALLDSVNNAAAVAEIESKYNTAEKERELIRITADKTELESKARKYWIFALIALLLALLVTGLVIFVYQKTSQRRKLDQAEFNAQLSEVKLTALRAQMNPHFVFNCINTAQNFVLKADKAMAYDYLSNFAKLLRLVLENANQHTVPIEDEVKLTELYIGLEAERFDQKFSYHIELDESLKNGVFEIPTMLVQPLVENALLHGLLNRADDQGELYLEFSKQGDYLYCMVRDNGVGRKEAAAIKARKKVHYQSAATLNIKERLEILKQSHKQDIKLQITDLDEAGRASGTKVELYLPLI